MEYRGGGEGVKVTTPRTGAKGKLTMKYDSDDFSPSDDSTPKATILKSKSDSLGNHYVKELLKKIKEKDTVIRLLELVISKTKVTSRMNKMKVREGLKWAGEETNLAETVNNFCRNFLFPKFKFLKDGWRDILPDKKNSFYSLCMRHLRIPEKADERDILERVIVPSVMRKYQHMKCNLNNNLKSIYMSMIPCL